MANGDERLHRWDHWLKEFFPRACFRRPDLCSGGAGSPEEVVWQVEVRSGKDGRIHVTEDALHLDPEGFAEVTRVLEANDWSGLVDRFVRVRIEGNGTVGALNS